MSLFSLKHLKEGVSGREVLSWAAFDFANSGYTTVVLTAVFNAYFVSVICEEASWATLLWTTVIAASNILAIVSMPLIGAASDLKANKKFWTVLMSLICIAGTVGLAFTGTGRIVWAVLTSERRLILLSCPKSPTTAPLGKSPVGDGVLGIVVVF